ncbi:MAG: LLM class flavin-dependent oxidoreductase [Catenulispora sp.]|nr:LLM class flavin-dependent oxidoreductase [Catenulispora sp.]
MLHIIASQHVSENPSAEAFIDLARTAERGLLDAVFLDDRLALPEPTPGGDDNSNGGGISAADVGGGGLEPLTLLSAIATTTDHIGLIATLSTTFSEPYPLARSLASLDHISHGRAGWSIGTGGDLDEAANFNMDEPVEAAVRYERAAELLDVVTQLWDSWADDAVLSRGQAPRIREIEHTGLFFKVRGPLNVRRTPQGWPLLVHQADLTGPVHESNDTEFAARYAEVVFTAPQDIRASTTFAREVKARAAAYGREPFLPIILPSLTTLVRPSSFTVRTPKQIADVMEEWTQAGAADGFTVRPSDVPGGLTAFVDHVVPELQRRGLFRDAYLDGTLRDRFGLPRPEDHFPTYDTLSVPQPPVAWPALATV